MPPRSQIFRVFVSSTFDDFHAERNALQNDVFKRLDELCRPLGSAFQAIDLRWGVSQEAAREQLTMRICREEIARCRALSPAVFFLGLVGERYGWCPLPDEVPAPLFERILSNRPDSPLSRCYSMDKNAVSPVYCLLPRKDGEDAREEELHREFVQATQDLGFPREDRIAYCSSATEQELWQGPLSDPAAGAYCFLRTIEGEPSDPVTALRYRDAGAGREAVWGIRDEIRRRLPRDRVLEYTARWAAGGVGRDHLAQLCAEVYDRLSRAILAELSPDRAQGKPDRVAQTAREAEEHEEYGRQRTPRVFVPRQEHLAAIDAYVMGPSASPLAVVGLSGAGKSSLLAKAVEVLRPRLADNVVIQRFVGATPESSDPVLLLQGLCSAIVEGYANRIEATEGAARLRERRNEVAAVRTYERLVGIFRECLNLAADERPLLLVVDALDQLADSGQARAFPWVPPRLPPWVKFVVSTLSDTRPALERTVAKESFLELGGLGAAGAERLLQDLLQDVGRDLQREQWRMVRRCLKSCSLPLYVKILFERVRDLRSYDAIGDLGNGTTAIVTGLLDGLGEGIRHGSVLVSRALGYLAAARSGVTDEEMLSLLSGDAEVRLEFSGRYPKSPALGEGALLPQVVWSRLYLDLRPYLTLRRADGTRVLSFFHRQFGEVARSWALAGREGQDRHRALAAFFADSSQPLYRGGPVQRVPNARKVGELPFQQTRGGLWEEVVDTLTSFTFLDAKVRVCGPAPVLQDFGRLMALQEDARPVLSAEDGAALATAERLLRLSARALANDPTQLPAQIVGRFRSAALPRVRRMVGDAAASSGPWLRPVAPRLSDPDGALRRTVGVHRHPVRCACVLRDGTTVISGSEVVSRAGDSALKVWDLLTGEETGVLPGVRESVFALCVAGDRVVAGMEDGSLGVWEPAGGNRVGEPLRGHAGPVSAVAALPGGLEVLSGSHDGTIRVWDLRTGSNRTVGQHAFGVNGLAVSPQVGVALSASYDHTLKVWDLAGFSLRYHFQGHGESVDAVSVSVDGLVAASASADGSVILWNLRDGVRLSQLRTGGAALRSVSLFSAGGHAFVAAGDHEGGLFVWDLQTGGLRRRLRAHTYHLHGLAWAGDRGVLLSASGDTSVKVWDSAALTEGRGEEAAAVGRLPFLELDASGKRLRAIPWGEGGAIEPKDWPVVDLVTGEVLGQAPFAPWQGSRFVIGRRDPGKCTPGPLAAADLELDGEDFEVARQILRSWIFWRPAGAEPRLVPPEPWRRYQRVFPWARFYVDASGGLGEVRLVDLTSLREVSWRAHDQAVLGLAVSPDGHLLVTASADYTLRVWDVSARASGLPRLRWTLEDHAREINGVAMARESLFLVSVSDDWSAILWDLGGKELVRVARFDAEGPLVACEISPDGERIAVADEVGVVHVLHCAR